MKHTLVYLLSMLGLLIYFWFFANFLLGWSSNSIVSVLPAAVLAVGVWLSGAALVWAGRRRTARVWLVWGSLLLAALVLIPPIFHEHEPNPPQIMVLFPPLGFLLPQLLPCLALVVAAILLYTGLKQVPSGADPQAGPAGEASGGPKNTGKAAAAALVLSALVLAGGMYHLYWLFVWDSTYDPLDFLFLIVPILAALFSAALLAALLPRRPKLAALLYIIVVPVVMLAVFRSAKQVDYRALTGARAGRISQALEEYHARRGSYPDRLDQLAPGTMLTLPGPVILYGQDWCYQGAKDWYRLGYVDREHWSSPELFSQVVKTQGPAPSDRDLCAAEITAMEESYPDYYRFVYRRR